MKLNFDVNRVTIIRGSGSDKIIMIVDGSSPFPEMDAKNPGSHPPSLQIDCREGYAEEWLATVGITEFQLIDRK